MEQLPLGVRLRPASTFESFETGANGPLIGALRARTTGSGLGPLWLWAAPGAGRTHVLQATCQAGTRHGRHTGYLPLSESWLEPGVLSGFEQLEIVCLDDVDAVLGQHVWERALFTLYNELLERGHHLILSAAVAPAGAGTKLPDLASRLAACAVWALKPLAEDDHGIALMRRARALGIELGEETLQYLQRRLPRDFGALCEALDRLDGAALSHQRRLTVPFVRSVLESLGV